MDQVNVLDSNCYIRLIESWGSDERIVEAARMSTDKGFQGWGGGAQCSTCKGYGAHAGFADAEVICKTCKGTGKTVGDEKLLRYLYEHKHMTPFEMAGCIVEVQAPIFVFREWHRHRTQSYNELSARYTELPNLFYLPSLERLMSSAQDNINKQGSKQGFTADAAFQWRNYMEDCYLNSRESYDAMLKAGIAREVARMVIPVAQISRMRASANLRNWLGFLTLRMDPAAQYEIRCFANALGLLLEKIYPRTWELFQKGRA